MVTIDDIDDPGRAISSVGYNSGYRTGMYGGGVRSTNTINLAIVTDLDGRKSSPVSGP